MVLLEHPHGPTVKFKCFYIGSHNEKACLVPKDYRLAILEEFKNNLDIFRQQGVPIKTTRRAIEQKPRTTSLLHGYVELENFELKFVGDYVSRDEAQGRV